MVLPPNPSIFIVNLEWHNLLMTFGKGLFDSIPLESLLETNVMEKASWHVDIKTKPRENLTEKKSIGKNPVFIVVCDPYQ